MAGTKPGPAPVRQLTAVKDGNPSRRPAKEHRKLPPAKPIEPDWAQIFPSSRAKGERTRQLNAEAARCRKVAREAWLRWARVLHAQGFLSEVDPEALQDAAVCWAQIDRCNRDISRNGIWTVGERGAVKNPATTAIAQVRTAFKNYAAALGLAPAYRVGLVAAWDPGGTSGGEEEDPFD